MKVFKITEGSEHEKPPQRRNVAEEFLLTEKKKVGPTRGESGDVDVGSVGVKDVKIDLVSPGDVDVGTNV